MRELSKNELMAKELVLAFTLNVEVEKLIKKDVERKQLSKCPYDAEECINRNTELRDKCNCLWHICFKGKCPFYKDYRQVAKEVLGWEEYE